MGEREERLEAVRARLQRATTAQDKSPLLEPAALEEAQRLAEVLHDDDGDLEAMYLLGWLHWYRYQALPEGQGLQDLNTTIEMFTLCFITGVGDLPEPLLPTVADQAVSTATTFLQQALGSTDQALLSATVGLWQRILEATPTDHPNHAMYLNNLGIALRVRFERSGALADLEAAIEAIRAAVEATPTDHPNHAESCPTWGSRCRSGSSGPGRWPTWSSD